MTSLIDLLIQTLDQERVAVDAESLLHYGRDWSRLHTPAASAVVFPKTVAEVQALVLLANQHQFALVPSGGRTGLSGGATATQGEVVLSLEKMNQIIEFDEIEHTLTVQAGVITETIQHYAQEKGLLYPVDFAATGSSHIGGNIATNAGGIKVIGYGLTRQWVTGLKVVTGKGDILSLNQGLIKNATGYDFRHLFIGSEGSLGIIVEATIALTQAPKDLQVMVLAVPDITALLHVFQHFKSALTLTAFEMFSDIALNHVLAHGVQQPCAERTAFYALLEFDQTHEHVLEQALAAFEACMTEGWVVDGVVSQNSQQAQALWQLRERITESIAHHLPYKNDIAVRVSQLPHFLTQMDTLFAKEYPDFEVVWFGHIGDGNLHISILKPAEMAHSDFILACEKVNLQLFDVIAEHAGSISAEHGVGLTKKPYLHYTRSATEIAYMQAMKQVFDPNQILNPGKIFDRAS